MYGKKERVGRLFCLSGKHHKDLQYLFLLELNPSSCINK